MSQNRVIFLEGDQLRRLAKLVHLQEVDAVQKLEFKSEGDRRKYLDESKASYTSSLGMLDSAEETMKKFAFGDRTEAAGKIFECSRKTINFSLQLVRNYVLRKKMLGKAAEYTQSLINKLHNLDPNDPSGVLKLLADANEYEKAMAEYAAKKANFVYNSFAEWLKSERVTFEQLLNRFKTKLGFEGAFKNLEEAQKVQVYEEILEASGKGRALSMGFAKVMGAAGIAALLVTAGMMVWDVYSSPHKLETAVRDAVEVAASVGGTILGTVVGEAVAAAALGTEAAVLGVSLVTVGGVIGGFAGAFILGLFAGWLIDMLFHTGETHQVTEPTTQSQHVYVVTMPDGLALAHQIAHHT